MKINEDTKNRKMQTRAELINRSRSSAAREILPPQTENMFDILSSFKQGNRDFIDMSQVNKQ
ncbi:MAG: hypothetical protein PF450_11260 [Bacteroidales bacterium]|jgi:lauroyl/myristoyl acyltransferase|nr:hypothetical protein [Bacteroidales bacterium]